MFVEPVLMAFLSNVQAHNDPRITGVAHLNQDLVHQVSQLVERHQLERVSRKVVEKRAIRALEIGYSLSVEQTDYKTHRRWTTDPRIDISNMGAYEAILQELVDRGTVFFMEAALDGNQLKEGVEAIQKTKMSRAMKGAERILDLVTNMRWLLSQDDVDRWKLVGDALANVSRVMSAGLTTDLLIARELIEAGQVHE